MFATGTCRFELTRLLAPKATEAYITPEIFRCDWLNHYCVEAPSPYPPQENPCPAAQPAAAMEGEASAVYDDYR